MGQVVSKFNKEIKKHENLGNNILPDLYDYKDLKNRINSRKELNAVISSLKRIQNKNAFELMELDSGEIITKWEYKDLKRRQKNVLNRLYKEKEEFEIPDKSGYSMAQMGDMRYNNILKRIEDFEDLEYKVGNDLKNLKSRLYRVGGSDYELRKASIYKQNYLNVLQEYSRFDNYDILMNKLNTFQNPISFYEFMKNGGELIADIYVTSNQTFTQEEFNKFIVNLGIELKIDSITLDENKGE